MLLLLPLGNVLKAWPWNVKYKRQQGKTEMRWDGYKIQIKVLYCNFSAAVVLPCIFSCRILFSAQLWKQGNKMYAVKSWNYHINVNSGTEHTRCHTMIKWIYPACICLNIVQHLFIMNPNCRKEVIHIAWMTIRLFWLYTVLLVLAAIRAWEHTGFLNCKTT